VTQQTKGLITDLEYSMTERMAGTFNLGGYVSTSMRGDRESILPVVIQQRSLVRVIEVYWSALVCIWQNRVRGYRLVHAFATVVVP
jgi:hypothetical protein